jgi:hypothetical protein
MTLPRTTPFAQHERHRVELTAACPDAGASAARRQRPSEISSVDEREGAKAEALMASGSGGHAALIQNQPFPDHQSSRAPAERASQSDSFASGAGVKPRVSDSSWGSGKGPANHAQGSPDPRSVRPRTLVYAFALILAFFTISPISAGGAESEPTRDSYKAAVEPICKENRAASDRYLSGVRKLVKKDKLHKAAENFTKAAAALENAHKKLAAVEQPPADAAKLAKWLAGIKRQVSQLRAIAAKLKAGKVGPASALSVRLTHDATTTNNQVIVFGFNYCRIDPSRYT